jgi:hypothetical protein
MMITHTYRRKCICISHSFVLYKRLRYNYRAHRQKNKTKTSTLTNNAKKEKEKKTHHIYLAQRDKINRQLQQTVACAFKFSLVFG